jgi:biopolymer transport protein ExbB
MMLSNVVAVSTPSQALPPVHMTTLSEMLVRGGPVMIPLGLCSVLSLMWILDRALRMRRATLGSQAYAQTLIAAARHGGPTQALEISRASPTVLGSIFGPVFKRWTESRSSLEKAVEDTGSRELRGLISSLRPLTVITVSAPLLGLLGTVIGIIVAFRDIAMSNAMGKPEALASGIAQALVCTAAGLAIAIPTQASYYWLRSRIDRFWRLVEETGEQVFELHSGRAPAVSAPVSEIPPVPSPLVPLQTP